MLETLLGGLMGGIFRIVPEVLKWLDRAAERKHELLMQDKALDFEKLRGANRMTEMATAAQAAWDTGTLAALKSAISAQGGKSGIKWADALTLTVRPVITYWFMMLYCAAKAAGFVAALQGGTDLLVAIPMMWNQDDMAIWAGLLNFWFLGRVFEKAGHH